MVFTRLFIFSILCLVSIKAKGQNYGSLLSSNSNLELSQSFSKADSLKSYLDFEEAEALYIKIGNSNQNESIKCYSKLSRLDNFLRQRKLTEAKSLLLELTDNNSCPTEENIVDLAFLKAQYLYQFGLYDSSKAVYKLIKPSVDKLDESSLYKGSFYNNFGELYLYGFEDVPKAKELFDLSVRYWEMQDDKNHFNLGRIYYNLGVVYGRRTESEIQYKYGEKALSIAKHYSNKYPRLQFGCYSLLAEACGNRKNFKETIIWADKELSFAIEHKLEKSDLLYVYNMLAESNKETENFIGSLKYYKLILENIDTTSNRYVNLYTVALRGQAFCLYELGMHSKSEKYFKKALEISKWSDRRHAQTLRYYGEFLLQQKRYEEATIINDSSIAIYNRNWENEENESYLYGLILGWKQKGLLLLQEERTSKALEAFLRAAYYMDCHRDIYYFDETQLNMSSIIKPLYENIILTSNLLFEETNDSSHLEHIFYAMESNKYQTLWKKIQDKEIYQSDNIPDSIALIIEALQAKIKTKTLQYRKENNSNPNNFIEIGKLKETLADITNDEFSYKFASNSISLSDYRDKLLNKEAVLQLFEGDSICHGLLISNSSTQYFNFGLSNNYKVQVNKYQHIIRGDELNLPYKNQLDNYIACIEVVSAPFNNAIKTNYKSLSIIPDGIFNFLPFESFIGGTLEGINGFEFLPYYVNQMDISYYISSKSLYKSRELEELNESEVIKAIGPSKEAILYEAIEEVNHIEERFGKKSKKMLSNQRAALLTTDSNDKILHIASHAVIDSNNYHLSYLHFGDQSNDSLKVYDYEISNHRFNHALVVLNACETFQGKMYKGEGVYSLSQSFLIGGASSVISTLWKIEDRSAARFMNRFYEGVNNGKTFKKSICESKRYMIKNESTAHPFFWAGYLYIGESNIVQKNKMNTLYYILPIIFLVIISLVLFVKLYFEKAERRIQNGKLNEFRKRSDSEL